MKQIVVPSQYLQIALDLAGRVARGEFPEGSRIYGRSVMASEYNVSPETIRRALRLLADMQVVEIRPQSGVVVLSASNAPQATPASMPSTSNSKPSFRRRRPSTAGLRKPPLPLSSAGRHLPLPASPFQILRFPSRNAPLWLGKALEN